MSPVATPVLLEIRALTKRLHAGVPGCRASALVLADVWLRVAAGERVAIDGPAGPSRGALLLIACGLMRPCAGSVRVRGLAAYVPPAAPPLGGLTVAELLEWERRALLARGAVAPLAPREALRTAACEELAEVRARLLSDAAARRVALARALVSRPALLAVDAPALAPLPDEWRAMERGMERAASAGAAVLFAAPAGVAITRVRTVWLAAPRARDATTRPRRVGRGGMAPPSARRAVAERAPAEP